MNGNRFLLDTNVLVYAYDRTESQKQQQAVTLLSALVTNQSGIVSTQTLAEFYVTVTRRLAFPLSAQEGLARLQNFLQTWRVLDVTGLVVLEAARGVRDYQLNYWDAQIWAVARLNQITFIFSEDFNVGAQLEGIRFVNPFAADFHLERWLQ